MALRAAVKALGVALGGPHEQSLHKPVWSPEAIHTRWGDVDRRLRFDYRDTRRTSGGSSIDDRGLFRPKVVAAFVFGFWIMDVANNMTLGPCRALLADLTGNPL
jgi:hypothetical protein